MKVGLLLVARWAARGPLPPPVGRCAPGTPSKACFAVGGTLCWG